MITKDVQSYAAHNWNEFLCSVTELSKSEKGISLVQSSAEFYNFDAINKSLFTGRDIPTSADALYISDKSAELVEFKSGFKQRITKRNFDSTEGQCAHIGNVCKDYWNLFFKNQKNNIHMLISSIRFKAIESYVTLEKQVFPLCQDTITPIPLKLIVVIDEDEIESMEDTYSELAGGGDTTDNHFSAIRSSLRRLIKQRSTDGTDYFYDQIEVLSSQDYANRLKLKS